MSVCYGKAWMHSRQLGGRGGPWAVWADATELDRLRALKNAPDSGIIRSGWLDCEHQDRVATDLVRPIRRGSRQCDSIPFHTTCNLEGSMTGPSRTAVTGVWT